jgi:SpoIIAA-like
MTLEVERIDGGEIVIIRASGVTKEADLAELDRRYSARLKSGSRVTKLIIDWSRFERRSATAERYLRFADALYALQRIAVLADADRTGDVDELVGERCLSAEVRRFDDEAAALAWL